MIHLEEIFHSLNNFLNTFLGAPFWKGLGVIITTLMVFFTYWSLKTLRKERKIQLNREIVEKIYNVLLQDLKTIFSSRKIENLESIHPKNWKWEEIKRKEPWISYQISQHLFKKLNKFSQKVKDYEKIRISFREEFEKFLTKIVKSKKILSEEELDRLEKVETITYWEGEGSTWKSVSIFELFFYNKNIYEFFNTKKLKGKFLLDYFLYSQGRKRKELNEEEFNKIWQVVNNRDYAFSRSLNLEAFQKIKEFYKEVKNLNEEIAEQIFQLTRERL